MATITRISIEEPRYSMYQGVKVVSGWDWVVEGDRGRIVYPREYHECMVRKMYTEGIESISDLRMVYCNGCSGASYCDRCDNK